MAGLRSGETDYGGNLTTGQLGELSKIQCPFLEGGILHSLELSHLVYAFV